MRAAILVYRYTFSAFLGNACRFRPTCSEYALEAVGRHGALRGGSLAVRRLCQCHPWGSSGFDPVPGTGESPEGIDPSHGSASGRRPNEGCRCRD
ncbi:membrane protein insertion efficiency factor YidD [Fodinicurvata sp. EGI_FJ10296]|uniref:membrane protein insertion efficiency factor YidD n=1 Tax=Fodinicurvata sp. EGI_FJ10296 TaxID=3231908 RepID=UPI0034533371